MRILFFVGKGGVGKSTNSALFAVKLAESGRRVMLNSIDPAHNLHDIFKGSLGPKPKELMPNLFVQETDLESWVKKYLKNTEKEFKSVYRYQEAFNLHKYFKTLKYSPGLEEYAVLLALTDTIEKNEHKDFIIFDTPPTALTLKFLALPDVSLLWLNELIKFRQMILDKKEIITRIKSGRKGRRVEMDPILARIEALTGKYQRLAGLLKDPEITSVFIILNPYKLSLAESKIIWRELKGLKMSITHLILNKFQGEEDFALGLGKEFPGTRVLKFAKQKEEITGIDTLESLKFPLDPAKI